MNAQHEDLDNPYKAPGSTLADISEAKREWTRSFISDAEEFARCLLFGVGIAVSIFVLATVAFDSLMNGWSETLFGAMPNGILMMSACLITVACTVPISKFYVRFRRRRNTLNKFVSTQQEGLRKWHGGPLVTTLFIAFGSAALWLFFETISNLWSLDLTWLAMRSRALLAVPLAMPLVYLVLWATLSKARKLIEQLSSNIQ